MPRVLAWQCDLTKKVFAEKKDYQRHLRRLGKTALIRRQHVKDQERLKEMIEEVSSLTSFDEIARKLRTESEVIVRHAAVVNFKKEHAGREPSDLRSNFRINYLELYNLKWMDKIRCDHSAPRGRQTNWGMAIDKPAFFPGWAGKIRMELEDERGYYFDVLHNLGSFGVHSGGGGHHTYDVVLYAEDFPAMFMWKKLNGAL